MTARDLPLDESALDTLADKLNVKPGLIAGLKDAELIVAGLVIQARAALDLAARLADAERERDEQAAHAARLREALDDVAACEYEDSWSLCGECRAKAMAALASTPADALAEHDAKVRAEEREACAKVCDYLAAQGTLGASPTNDFYRGVQQGHENCSAAIRARTPAAGSGEKEA